MRDDAYLHEFARQLREFDFPVFIRFASEMNGFWTKTQYGWNGDAKVYREKFRVVNRVLHEIAPRVATIWCVNNPPLGNALDYYPGDDGCDWVGVNFYAVPYHEDKINQPAFNENPLALLDPIYKRFAGRKPIAICEFAASHQARVDPRPVAAFAASKLRLVYGALPLLYPRVKIVDWFNANTLKLRTKDKTPNDYLLTDNTQVLKAWQDVTQNRHFLQSYLGLGDKIPPVLSALWAAKKSRCRRKLACGRRTLGATERCFWAWTDSPGCAPVRRRDLFAARPTRFESRRPHAQCLLYDSQGRFQKRVDAKFST